MPHMKLSGKLKAYIADIVIAGIGLCVFALFHHVIPQGGVHVQDDFTLHAQATYAPQTVYEDTLPSGGEEGYTVTDAVATGDTGSEPDAYGMAALFDSIELGDIKEGETRIETDNIKARIRTVSKGGAVMHMADIYIRDLTCLRTAFARDIYGKGYRSSPVTMANDKNALIAISGDYYGARDKGLVVRNGEIYRKTMFKDMCIIYDDGVMETVSPEDFSAQEALERGMWQAWSFGPKLLDEEGHAYTEFDSEVAGRNPRCGIGYCEPGHYVFIVVDGRTSDSHGMTLAEFAALFEGLGCTCAYNLDGGDSACMVVNGEIYSDPSGGGRAVTDIIYIAEAD